MHNKNYYQFTNIMLEVNNVFIIFIIIFSNKLIDFQIFQEKYKNKIYKKF